MAPPNSNILPTKHLHHQSIVVYACSRGLEAVYKADAVKAARMWRSWRSVVDRDRIGRC